MHTHSLCTFPTLRRSNGLFQLWNKYERRLRSELFARSLLATGDKLYRAEVSQIAASMRRSSLKILVHGPGLNCAALFASCVHSYVLYEVTNIQLLCMLHARRCMCIVL